METWCKAAAGSCYINPVSHRMWVRLSPASVIALFCSLLTGPTVKCLYGPMSCVMKNLDDTIRTVCLSVLGDGGRCRGRRWRWSRLMWGNVSGWWTVASHSGMSSQNADFCFLFVELSVVSHELPQLEIFNIFKWLKLANISAIYHHLEKASLLLSWFFTLFKVFEVTCIIVHVNKIYFNIGKIFKIQHVSGRRHVGNLLNSSFALKKAIFLFPKAKADVLKFFFFWSKTPKYSV